MAKEILKKYQYPPDFYEPIIRDTLTYIIALEEKKNEEETTEKPFLIFLQYRGKCSESYARDIRRLYTTDVVTSVPCRIVFTLKKLRTVLPSLKEPVEKFHRSRLGNLFTL